MPLQTPNQTQPVTVPDLPAPSADALAHSARLTALIEREIAGAGGWISFARYMELALYAPGLGYYSAGSTKLGGDGDFVTAPEISSLFGETLAQQLADLLNENMPDILELGAGSGKLACDVLLELESLQQLPVRYLILELSAELRGRQRRLLETRAPGLANRVQWLDALPHNFRGVAIANEVLDALPAHVVAWSGAAKLQVSERGVTGNAADGFTWAERPATGELLAVAQMIADAPEDSFFDATYVNEINLAASALIGSLASCMAQGAMLFIDYGFPRHEYYHPQRNSGTLMCHYRHRAHADPFYLPGLQDITAHVDFTAIRDAATANGLECLGFATQAQFLINCGITGVLSRVSATDPARYLPRAAEAQKLLSPSEMGELFKVIALGKGLDSGAAGGMNADANTVLQGFAAGDMRARLG
jgi:SAM-dependent MidA family methyltransferase